MNNSDPTSIQFKKIIISLVTNNRSETAVLNDNLRLEYNIITKFFIEHCIFHSSKNNYLTLIDLYTHE